MSKEKHGWSTEFDTSNRLMIHKMTERVSVVSNIGTGIMKVYKDGLEKYSINNPSITEYGELLSEIYSEALELEKINHYGNR